MNKNNVLEARNLTFAHSHDQYVFNNINFVLKKQQVISILGENGIGKSTLLDCLSGLSPAMNGTISLNNKDIRNYSKKEISSEIGYLSQNFPQTYNYLVKDYVLFGIVPKLNSMLSKPKLLDYESVFEVLKQLNISQLFEKSYFSLSGGERQLVNLAKILLQDPKIILLDEPMAALDYKNTITILKLIYQLRERGISVIFTTHNPEHILLLKCDVAIMKKNGITQGGIELIDSQCLSELYQTSFSVFYSPILKRRYSGISVLF